MRRAWVALSWVSNSVWNSILMSVLEKIGEYVNSPKIIELVVYVVTKQW